MSKSIKIRTNSDKAKSLLFNAIVNVRTAYKATKDTSKAIYKETIKVTKDAMNHQI